MTKRVAAAITGIWFAAIVLAGEAPGGVSRSVRADVDWARAIVLQKLESSQCRLIFLDFEDSDGRTLQSNLESRGETGADLMSHLDYRDGSSQRTCKSDGVLAFTMPGADAIFICGPKFRRVLREHRNLAANILLHEGLHCLGLEELSPLSGRTASTRRLLTSLEITDQVAFRCGN
jgi:hypothetical protein